MISKSFSALRITAALSSQKETAIARRENLIRTMPKRSPETTSSGVEEGQISPLQAQSAITNFLRGWTLHVATTGCILPFELDIMEPADLDLWIGFVKLCFWQAWKSLLYQRR